MRELGCVPVQMYLALVITVCLEKTSMKLINNKNIIHILMFLLLLLPYWAPHILQSRTNADVLAHKNKMY